MNNWLPRLGLYFGPVSFLFILFFIDSPGLNPQAQAMLALTAWMAIWWISEALPIAVTAFLPLVFMPLLSILQIEDVSSNYMHPTVMLYMGGFLLATAIEKWGLHRRIALSIIHLIGTDLRMIVLGFIVATGFISMWISNSATALMMLPIGLAVVNQVKTQLANSNELVSESFGKNIMLGIAYSASIGGLGTIIGTPTNLVFAGVIEELYDYKLGFIQWMMFGVPLVIGLILICWFYLVNFGNKLPKNFSIPDGKSIIRNQLKSLGKITFEEKIVLIVFGLVCLAWIIRGFVLDQLIPGIDDTIIVLIGVVLVFVLPSSTPGERILDWKTAERIPWGVLILFGGGLALAEGFKVTGLADWIGSGFSMIEGLNFFLLLLIIVASVVFLSEVTSNVATAAMILPILASVALKFDLNPLGIMVGATIAASCAFMLPVGTPPNAVVFASGFLQIKDMVKSGFWLNVTSIILITLMVYFILPVIWGIELEAYPF
ncbi:DASS family sodium-coupled anion symporter [Algoriphagus sp. A40]|uniref:SLC13 family permease n=1 Tax=Algoriphagus sp. A40 TaxID=1945863 RepID=UPI00098652EF|nr:DASS family sodium-coupled anion symporter [Algoriphagus sp. A40]OOG73663.1 anion transporter [Algoriphagus sp. A40]